VTDDAEQMLDLLAKTRLLSPEVIRRLRYFRRTRHTVEYVSAKLATDIRLEIVAALVAMQHSAFSRYFSEKCGVTFHEFLRAARIARAIELISTDEYSISELTRLLGFKSRGSFGRAFRSLTGSTPTAYRARVLSGRTNTTMSQLTTISDHLQTPLS
jgi:AraC-like DNA-binding protein